ncbi:DUF4245 family protein [Microbacterium hominis]|uniref:DUF4245 domain-containing protein n=1 Tax=Microbacterium hominis TaxID=162426 RepID=A0A7D4U414_9MICO|nr:DUF4245 family protein [Microbacterium hominis]QKJ19065.1 DUF4245 domain-containing protein [Microbacterium hominis]
MAREPRIVAELGRPETPDETAARKAESSRVYRSSKNIRNLVAALLATLAILLVIVLAVPRGTPPEAEPIDVEAVAADIAVAEDRIVVSPDVPDQWRVNGARIEGDGPRAWTIIYAPETGFLRVAQGFDADPAWPGRMLSGATPDGTVRIAGVEWTRYDIANPERAGNISAALSVEAGTDIILIYGAAAEDLLETAAAGMADDVIALREETP